ncbi:MAG TPA: hypothetical protein PKI11_19060, partial [Candidatus Hydrogenedentes bacterium]|nr:hypothetical protein [Candidatus Hydrogenedentota bacterium]
MKCESWYVASSRAACLAALLLIGLGAASAAEQSADEARLIEVLKSDAGWPEKQEACRALRQQGTTKAVPTLAALLGDERLSHMARYALE